MEELASTFTYVRQSTHLEAEEQEQGVTSQEELPRVEGPDDQSASRLPRIRVPLPNAGGLAHKGEGNA